MQSFLEMLSNPFGIEAHDQEAVAVINMDARPEPLSSNPRAIPY